MKLAIWTLSFMLFCVFIHAQPGIEWSKNISGERAATPNDLIKGPNNGYYSAGRLGADAWAVRVDNNFNTVWELKTLGGSGLDAFQGGNNQMIMASNGDLVVAGSSYSSDGDLSANYGNQDAWIIRIQVDGRIGWSRNYGTSAYDNCTGLLNAGDGGFYAMFNSYGSDNDFPALRGVSDIWIAKLDFKGDILWKKQFGGTNREYAFSWVQGQNGNITVAARSESIDFDLAGTDGTPALWLFQVDPNGNMVWSRTYAGVIDLFDLQLTRDGGFIVCGKAFASSAYFGNNGKDDAFIQHFDANGRVVWSKNFGGSEGESFTRMTVLSDGNFAAVGKSFSADGDLNGHYGKGDCWVMKLNKDGNTIWSKNVGGTNGDSGVSLIEQKPGQYYLYLFNGSFDGDFDRTPIRPGPTVVKLNENLNSTTGFNMLDISVAPTLVPQGDPIRVSFPDQQNYSIQLFDITGKQIVKLEVTGPEASIPTAMLQTGSYIYLIERGDFRNTGKLVIH